MKQKKKQKLEESLSYTVEVRGKEGRVIQCISAPSRSYVKQWNQIVNVESATSVKTVQDTGGVGRIVYAKSLDLRVSAGIGIVLYGIRVGKGSTAVAITDFALETPCGEGTGTDEFNHQAVTFTEPSVVGSTCSFTVKRVMINNSGSTITGIREIGAYVVAAGTAVYYMLGFRDVLPSPVYVPHGGSITVTYTIAVTV